MLQRTIVLLSFTLCFGWLVCAGALALASACRPLLSNPEARRAALAQLISVLALLLRISKHLLLASRA